MPRRGDAGAAGSTSRSRNDGSGQKSRNYKNEITVLDTDTTWRLFQVKVLQLFIGKIKGAACILESSVDVAEAGINLIDLRHQR